MSELKDKIISEIKKIYDPEIPVNIYELGLIYKIDVKDVKKINEDFLNMIKNKKKITVNSLSEDQITTITSLSGVQEFPMRVKCATMAWHTCLSAVEKK